MEWTREQPKRPGYYWFWPVGKGYAARHIVCVDEDLDVWYFGADTWCCLIECAGRWAGPLEAPPESA